MLAKQVSRLHSQELPSTNTLVLIVRNFESHNIQSDIYSILCSEVKDLQCMDFSQLESKKQIRATFFDVRDAYKVYCAIQNDNRFDVVLDLKGGTNRSVVLPRGDLSIDLIYSKMRQFGEIEKIWFDMVILGYDRSNAVIDYFDSRAPLLILRKLELSSASSSKSRLISSTLFGPSIANAT